MGTTTSDVSYNLFLHQEPRHSPLGRYGDHGYNKFERDRWVYWQRHASLVSVNVSVLRQVSTIHGRRLKAVAKVLPRRTIRNHNLDDPFLSTDYWIRKILARMKEHRKRRGHKFEKGHLFEGNQYRKRKQ